MKKKNTKPTRTPRLRFPEFRDEPGWEEKQLGEMSERIVEKVGDAKLTPVSITAGKGFVSQIEKFGRDISGAQYKNYISLHQGDFAYNKGNSKSYPQGCVRRLKEFEQAAAPNAFYSFRLQPGYVPEFFEGLFEKNAHGRQLVRFITSSARSDGLLNISAEEFFSVKMPIPPETTEQQKIADCLSSLDGLIAAEGRKLAALRDHKRGLMQQLFPQPGQTQPRLRFPEFQDKGEWEEKALGTVGFFTGGGTPSKDDESYWAGEIPWVSSSDLSEESIYEINISRFITEKAVRESATKLVPANSILLVSRVGVGKLGISTGQICTSQDFTNFTPKDSNLIFLAYLLKSMKDILLSFNQGTSIKGFTKDNIASLDLGFPSPAEQQKIAACLSALDDQITAQAAKIETLKQHKRGLMQQLFPSPEEE